MAFDWQKLRLLRNSFEMREMNFVHFRPAEIEVLSDNPEWSGKLDGMTGVFNFRPHFGWLSAIENDRQSSAA
jgi:hypothetical protein